MKKVFRTKFLLLCISVFSFCQQGFSQNSIGLNVGLSSYEGDLHCFEEADLSLFNSAGISFGIHAKRELGKYFAGRVAYQFASFKGNDSEFSTESGHPSRNFSFTNNVHELTFKLDLEPWKSKVVSPFVSIGAGIGFGNPDTDYSTTTNSTERQLLVQEDIDELKKTFFALPVSAGLNFRVSEVITIGTEFGLRISSGDYLDGVSISGSDEYNDYFGTGVISLNYALGGKSVGNISNRRQMTKIKEEPQPIAKEMTIGADPGDIPPAKQDIVETPPPPPPPPPLPESYYNGEKSDKDDLPKMETQIVEEEIVMEKPTLLESDLDGDGYADKVDNCPRVYSLTNNGCPENSVNSDVDCGASFGMNSVQFQTSIADLSIEDKETINSVIAILSACPDLRVRIEGHTDSRGKDYVNQALSESRAKSVKAYIMRAGISNNRIRTVGYGETQPIADNDSELGRSQNRRVEISFF